MNSKIIKRVISGIVCIVLGVLIAIYGTDAIDTYLGIILCVIGAGLLGFEGILLKKKVELNPIAILYGATLLTLGIFLFTDVLTVTPVVNFIVVTIVGIGAGLLLYGAYLLSRKEKFSGFLDTLLGVVALVIAILFLTVERFREIFWIIFGVVFAAYGLLTIITAFIKPKEGKVQVKKEKKVKVKKEVVPEEKPEEPVNEKPAQIEVIEVKEIEEKKEEEKGE